MSEILLYQKGVMRTMKKGDVMHSERKKKYLVINAFSDDEENQIIEIKKLSKRWVIRLLQVWMFRWGI